MGVKLPVIFIGRVTWAHLEGQFDKRVVRPAALVVAFEPLRLALERDRALFAGGDGHLDKNEGFVFVNEIHDAGLVQEPRAGPDHRADFRA